MEIRKSLDYTQNPIKKIIKCVHCSCMLWEMIILSHKDGNVMATRWKSLKPELYDGRPASWDCPMCSQPFAKKVANEYKLKVIDPKTGLTGWI